MKLQKNDDIELVIEAMTSQGSGIGHYESIAVFVYGTVTCDKIVAHIIKVKKNYAVGIVKELVTPSPHRIQSDCAVSDRCGGCAFRCMSYEEELRYKKDRVQDAVKRIGHLDITVEDIIGAEKTERYRNKAQYPVKIENGRLTAGFYAINSHRVIACPDYDCKLSPKEFSLGISAFERWINEENISSYDEQTGKGYLRHIYFRKAFATDEIMACAVVNSKEIINPDFLVKCLTESLKNIKSIQVNFNTSKSNVILSNDTVTVWGNDTITDELLGKRFIISPNSFYQVNRSQCEVLYKTARDFAKLKKSDTLLDLYCGVGTIGITMAESVNQLIGVEIVPDAVKNARLNAKLNGIENARFICADASTAALKLKDEGISPNVIILDPPRKGCDVSLINTVVDMAPERIVYVSCDSATLARDLAIFESMNYKTERLTAVDMFPRTTHVEAVALIEKVSKAY